MTGRLVVVGGGVRSGKSKFALRLATRLGERRVFVATGLACDEEMRQRIAHHREQRGDDFRTVEAGVGLTSALRRLRDADVVVVDCLTLFLSRCLISGGSAASVEAAAVEFGEVVRSASCHVVVVTNEVGMGVVPDSRLGREFRDVSGRAHQHLASLADEVYFAVLGMMLRLKPAPLEPVTAEALA